MSRYLLYSHDTYGLGHFRRSGLIAAGLVGADPDNEVLIVTGSPRAEAFELPDRVDTVKLPTVTKGASGHYRPRKLNGAIGELVGIRSSLIESAVTAYEPDVIVVDHAPVGMGGELRPTLERLAAGGQHSRPRLVLGLRDIVDDAERVDAAWSRDAVWEALDHYDDIVVYGDPYVGTTAIDLDLAYRTAATVTHTGYVAPRMPDPVAVEPFLLVTAGGGGDGHQLVRRFLRAVEHGATKGVRSVVVTGPLLSPGRRAELAERAAALASVEMIEFSGRMRELIASAAGVISMAGYNTVVEELAANVPALLVPRRRPRLEQHVRASRVAPVSRLEHCPLEMLTAGRVRDFVETIACSSMPRDENVVDLRGIAATVTLIDDPTPAHRRTPAHA